MKSQFKYASALVAGLTLLGFVLWEPVVTIAPVAHAHTPTKTNPTMAQNDRPMLVAKKVQKPAATKKHPTIGKRVQYTPPPLPDLDALKLPQSETGGHMLFPVDTGESQGHIEIQEDLQDPITALGTCTRWVVGCVDPGNRSLDDCARSVPTCTTDKPWEEDAHCCPATCFDNYATLREAGVEPIVAFDTVFFADGSCFPGVEDLVQGASPAPPIFE